MAPYTLWVSLNTQYLAETRASTRPLISLVLIGPNLVCTPQVITSHQSTGCVLNVFEWTPGKTRDFS